MKKLSVLDMVTGKPTKPKDNIDELCKAVHALKRAILSLHPNAEVEVYIDLQSMKILDIQNYQRLVSEKYPPPIETLKTTYNKFASILGVPLKVIK